MSTAYEAGFSNGERTAWGERRSILKRIQHRSPASDYERGWWDGYTPRNIVWAMRSKPSDHWTETAHSAEAVS